MAQNTRWVSGTVERADAPNENLWNVVFRGSLEAGGPKLILGLTRDNRIVPLSGAILNERYPQTTIEHPGAEDGIPDLVFNDGEIRHRDATGQFSVHPARGQPVFLYPGSTSMLGLPIFGPNRFGLLGANQGKFTQVESSPKVHEYLESKLKLYDGISKLDLTIALGPGQMFPCSLNGDTIPDFVSRHSLRMINTQNALTILEGFQSHVNLWGGQFLPQPVVHFPSFNMERAWGGPSGCADLNGDGADEVYGYLDDHWSDTSHLIIFQNDGTGSFDANRRAEFSIPYEAYSAGITPFISGAYKDLLLYYKLPQGTLRVEAYYLVNGEWVGYFEDTITGLPTLQTVENFDIDGDGDTDFLIYDYDGSPKRMVVVDV